MIATAGWVFASRLIPARNRPQIILHVSLLDRENLTQQEAIGILGVNLIHASFYEPDPVALIKSLIDDLSSERIEVDLIKFSGPAFEEVDNRLMSLELVHYGLSGAAMFTTEGEVVQPAEAFHKKSILLVRGSFRPVTNVAIDMLGCALAQFVQEPAIQDEDVLVVTEMTLNNLIEGDTIDKQDFLDRVDILGTLDRPVLITNYGEFYRLANYVQRQTTKMIGLAMGVPTLQEIFEEKYYNHLAGGILESFGRLFKNDLKLYAYPLLETKSGALITAENLLVAPQLQHLYNYLLENQHIQAIRGYNRDNLRILSREVFRKMHEGDSSWEHDVPESVAALIRERKLLGYNPAHFSPSPAV